RSWADAKRELVRNEVDCLGPAHVRAEELALSCRFRDSLGATSRAARDVPMHVEPDGPAVSRFSTDDLPERDRIAMTREFFGPKVVGVDFAPVSDAPFRADLTLWSVPGL